MIPRLEQTRVVHNFRKHRICSYVFLIYSKNGSLSARKRVFESLHLRRPACSSLHVVLRHRLEQPRILLSTSRDLLMQELVHSPPRIFDLDTRHCPSCML